MTLRRVATAALATAAASMLAAACSASSATSTATAKTGTVVAVGAENEYANVISQIGGKYVRVTAIESNPNTDPHTLRGQRQRGARSSGPPSSSCRTASATTRS